ncbi:MAG: hypothetical protein WAV09_03535, partial [Minisyncoccia bacterium]
MASLIATLFVSFSLFSTSVEAGSKNELSFNGSTQVDAGQKAALDASANKVAPVATVTVYRSPEGLYSFSAAGNEVAFTAYAPGT